ncbi:alpha/beta hydrolase family protein [Kribbella orskensis]|uniref:Alpha/beta hydrolase family protein n=1 Tax=Kribbella orskensis TaxID=2512216 RepID=A0ABY2BQZ5_9ACTN|nr:MULTISPECIES: alpha/beta hydrolase [Kribbella]TCN41862.1 alpha/beta hydrolase family protein [Kribbella sp. VKM Ac-2500]TCO25740.1 alpha/beta hydrolase family protein [Kribbella orskensis]
MHAHPKHKTATPPGRRRRIAALGAAVLAVLIAAVSLAAPAEAHTTKPTIVLVHGAWADSTSWDKVARQLKDDGYRTVTPELGLNSVAEDVAIVRTAVDKISGKKVLVGHSYGGIVTAGASYGRTDISAFVYAAALVPDEGDSIGSLGADFTPSEAFGHLIFTGEPFASPAFIDPAFFHQYFAQDLSNRQAATLSAAQLPLNFPIVTTPSGPVGWHNVPAWYAVSGQDRMIDPAQERWMAARVGATVVEYPTASHVGGITRLASQFTALIEHAVRSTRVG